MILWRNSVKFSKDFSDGAILGAIFLESRSKSSHLGRRDIQAGIKGFTPPTPFQVPSNFLSAELDSIGLLWPS
jgi:hypothetical protein